MRARFDRRDAFLRKVGDSHALNVPRILNRHHTRYGVHWDFYRSERPYFTGGH